MKRTSLLLMGLLLQILLVKAQPYFPFPNKGITYFGGYLNSNIHYALAPLDSIVGQQPKQYTFAPAILPVYDNESSKECIANGLNSILGAKVENYGDTLFQFYNFTNASTKIYLNTPIGYSWVAYYDSSVKATFTHDTTKIWMINGIPDTAQVFSIVVENYVDFVTPIEYKPMVIGANTGLIQFPMFYTFPYPTNLFGNFAPYEFKISPPQIHNITWDSIYNFNVGDEFHVMYNKYWYDRFTPNSLETDTFKTVYEILQRNQPNPDSLCYLTKRLSYQNSFKNGVYTQKVISDTESIGYKRWEPYDVEPSLYVKHPYFSYTIANDQHGLFKLNHIQFIGDGNDSCIYNIFDAGYFPSNRYYNGLGGPYFEHSVDGATGSTGHESYQLVYYRKGNKSFGVPIPKTVGITESMQQALVTVYPNPAAQFVSINLATPTLYAEFNLYDAIGKLVLTQKLAEQTNMIGLTHLPKGMYFYSIMQGEKVVTGKLIKE